MRENYGGNKKRREEAKRKWQEEKRNKKLNRKTDGTDGAGAPNVEGQAPADAAQAQQPPAGPNQSL